MMLPSNEVWDAKAPVLQNWYLHGTKRSSELCPADHATLNHVEMYVDGPAPSSAKIIPVKPPSKDHLAALWRWPGGATTYAPTRVQTQESYYHEDERSRPGHRMHGPVHRIGADLHRARRRPHHCGRDRGTWADDRLPTRQRQHLRARRRSARVLLGRTEVQPLPTTELSQDRIEIYTDVGRAH